MKWHSIKTRPPQGIYIVSGKLKYEWETEWEFFVDVAEYPSPYAGDSIDGFATLNDWDEGQEIHIIAWMDLPEPIKEVENG